MYASRVIERLIREGKYGVIAIGGGAFADAQTRDLILDQGLAVWLRASLDVLVERTGRRDTRPLLRGGDPRQILTDLMAKREPAYAKAPIHTNSGLGRLDRTVLSLLNRANRHCFGTDKSMRKSPSRPRRRRPKAKP